MSEASTRLSAFEFPAEIGRRLSHYAFRYPAKFHPPVVRELVQRYSKKGQVCCDPFCGSGTRLVEARRSNWVLLLDRGAACVSCGSS